MPCTMFTKEPIEPQIFPGGHSAFVIFEEDILKSAQGMFINLLIEMDKEKNKKGRKE